MNFTEKFNLAKTGILEHCKHCIIDNWEKLFTKWLLSEASIDLGYGYKYKFKKHFEQYMDPTIEKQLVLAGNHIAFAIHAFLEIHDGVLEVEDILRFTELFLNRQMKEFDTWCGELRFAVEQDSEKYNTGI